jgi:hypothetical protein
MAIKPKHMERILRTCCPEDVSLTPDAGNWVSGGGHHASNLDAPEYLPPSLTLFFTLT